LRANAGIYRVLRLAGGLIDVALAERNERLATLLDTLTTSEKRALAASLKSLLLACGDHVATE
jgi:hypothetical protein